MVSPHWRGPELIVLSDSLLVMCWDHSACVQWFPYRCKYDEYSGLFSGFHLQKSLRLREALLVLTQARSVTRIDKSGYSSRGSMKRQVQCLRRS